MLICKWCLVWLVAAAVSGCTVYKIYTNADLKIPDGDKIPEGTSFFVLPDPESDDVALHESVRSRIEEMLQKKGYTIGGADAAEGYLLFGCGTGEGSGVSGILPLDQQVQSTSGKTTKWPGSSIRVDYPRLVKGRWLIMVVIDAAEYRKSGELKTFWLGDANSYGAERAFNEVIWLLLEDIFKYFGRNKNRSLRTRAVGNTGL